MSHNSKHLHGKLHVFPGSHHLSCQLGTNGYAFPLLIGVVKLCGSCHIVQFLLEFLQLSKQLTLIGGPSMVLAHIQPCVLACTQGEGGSVLYPCLQAPEG